MAEILLTCSQCQRQLRVPEELQGRLVKCPACGFTFTAERAEAPRQAPLEVADSADSRLSAYPPSRDWRPTDAGDLRDRARSRVLPPAICLLITGVIGLGVDAFSAVQWHVAGDQLVAQFKELFAGLGAQAPPPQVMVVMFASLSLLCLVVIIAAIQMMRLQTYWLAITGTILAMINFGNLCCLLGIPFGIWSLVMLLRQDVREAFQ
jgi:DNA-directed RNA polymerase subunit RPC12/RpoP